MLFSFASKKGYITTFSQLFSAQQTGDDTASQKVRTAQVHPFCQLNAVQSLFRRGGSCHSKYVGTLYLPSQLVPGCVSHASPQQPLPTETSPSGLFLCHIQPGHFLLLFLVIPTTAKSSTVCSSEKECACSSTQRLCDPRCPQGVHNSLAQAFESVFFYAMPYFNSLMMPKGESCDFPSLFYY